MNGGIFSRVQSATSPLDATKSYTMDLKYSAISIFILTMDKIIIFVKM